MRGAERGWVGPVKFSAKRTLSPPSRAGGPSRPVEAQRDHVSKRIKNNISFNRNEMAAVIYLLILYLLVLRCLSMKRRLLIGFFTNRPRVVSHRGVPPTGPAAGGQYGLQDYANCCYIYTRDRSVFYIP